MKTDKIPDSLFLIDNTAALEALIQNSTDIVNERIKALQKEVARTIRRNLELLGKTFEEHKIPFQVDKHTHNKLDRLVQLGWAFPSKLPLSLFQKIGTTKEGTDLDTKLTELYAANHFEAVRIIEKDLLSSVLLSPWKELLEECFYNVYEGRFRVSIPAFITLIEGAIMNKAGILNANEVRVISTANKLSTDTPSSIEELIFRSGASLIKSIFGKSDFDGKRPFILNRHWILHGRDTPASWCLTDAIKLTVLLRTLVTH